MNNTSQERWIWHGIYGQYKTAASVAYVLRREGWRVRIDTTAEDNHVVYKLRLPRHLVRHNLSGEK